MSTIKFWGNVISQPSRMVSYIMEKLNIEHEYIQTAFVKDTRSEEFLKNVNKWGQLPVIHDEELKLAESASILRYLCDVYDKDEVLLPRTDRKLRAKIESVLDYNGHSGKPVLSKAYQIIALGPKLRFSVPPTDEVFDALMVDVNKTLAYIDNLVADSPYVAGEKFSIADVQLYNEVFNWENFTGLNVSEYKNIEAWKVRVHEDEIVAKLDSQWHEAMAHFKPPVSYDVISYGHVLSQPSRTILYFLKKLDVSHKFVSVLIPTETRSKEFKRNINKFAALPAISHDGLSIGESATILRYLCANFDTEGTLMPKDRKQKARVEAWLDYNGHTFRDIVKAPFFHKIVVPIMGGPACTEEEMKEHAAKADTCFEYLEGHLSDSKFLVGDSLTIADVQLFNEVYQTVFSNIHSIDAEKFPKTHEWYDTIYNDPIVQGMDEEVKASAAGYGII